MKLEQIAKGAQISGIEPGKVVRVVSADPLGDNAVTVVYKADDGRLGERVLFRSNESELHIASVGRTGPMRRFGLRALRGTSRRHGRAVNMGWPDAYDKVVSMTHACESVDVPG